MGQQLQQWIEANSRTLRALAGPHAPPPAIPGAQGAPGSFPPQQAAAAPQAGFPARPDYTQAFPEAAPATAPQPAAFDMPFMQPQAPAQAPPAPKPATTGIKPKPREDEGPPQMGFSDMYDQADPESISKVIDLLEQQTGRPVEELYEQQTGRPPPRGTKKEKIGEFLLEFGLNLASAPAELSSFEAIGRSAQAARATGRQRDSEYAARLERAEDRRIAAKERATGRLDKKFDRAATLERLGMERQRTQATLNKPIGEFTSYVGPGGYMYDWNPETQEGRQVIVNGKPMKASDQAIAGKQQRFDTEVRYNMYMGVYGKNAEDVAYTGEALSKIKKDALKFANRQTPYTRAEANRESVAGATSLFKNDSNYALATEEEQRTMFRAKVAELTEMYMAGYGNGDGEPDASKLVEGIATAITNEAGITEYWMLKNGEKVKVNESQLVR